MTKLKHLHIDIETYSPEPIGDCGAYRYAMNPEFEILLVAYARDEEPTQIIDLASGEKLPEWFVRALLDHKVTKHAHNAVFERVCFTMWLRRNTSLIAEDEWLNPMDWECSSVKAGRCGLPLSLKGAGEALKLSEQKMDEGKSLIQLFCTPRKTKSRKISKTIQVADDNPELEKAIIDANLRAWSAGENRDANADALWSEAKRLEAQQTYHEEPNPDYDTLTSLFGTETLPKRVQPSEFPDKWETFKAYCIRDVDVERSIEKALSWYEVSDFEKRLYAIDQRINDYGVRIDLDMVTEANRMDILTKSRLSAEAVTLTGLSNPNSGTQLKAWLSERLGIDIPSLTKTTLPDIVSEARKQRDTIALRVLQIRAEMGKTSNAKYDAMLSVVGPDGRARGLTQFYGSRTGRWAGRLIQMQNLPQNHINALDTARQMLKDGDYDSLDLTFGNVPDTISQLIRTSFIPSDGKIYAVCDFSAIEARVLAWMAGEEWVLDTFRQGGDIYCATASQMFHKPVEKHGVNSELRQRGKVAVLALGYGGGVSALDKMGGARLGMTEEEKADTVKMWRNANPGIVAFWGLVEKAAKECIVYKTTRKVETPHTCVTFRMEDSTMTIELPSGRKICYPNAELHFDNEWACTGQTAAQAATDSSFIKKEKPALHPERHYMDKGASIRFMGTNQATRKWEWIETWGGKLTENIVQAVARDCLAETMTNCMDAGFPVVFHIHDELVMEVSSEDKLKEIQDIFAIVPKWADKLPLKGAGYTGNYYYKD